MSLAFKLFTSAGFIFFLITLLILGFEEINRYAREERWR